MHDPWEAMIPFYVAQTLAERDAIALQKHLSRCAICRQSLAEWRAIAAVTKSEAERQSASLPPLSSRVRAAPQRMTSNGFSRGAFSPPPRTSIRRVPIPATLIAAVAALLVFGWFIIYMISRTNPSDDAPEGTGIAALSPGLTETVIVGTPSPTIDGTAQNGAQVSGFPTSQDLGFLPTPTTTPGSNPLSPPQPAPSQTPRPGARPSASPSPQVTPRPTQQLQGFAATSATPSPFAPPPQGICSATAPAGVMSVHVYASTYPQGVIVDELYAGQYLRVMSADVNNGYTAWIEVQRSGGDVGWVTAGSVILYGPCGDLVPPTPTYPPATPTAVYGDSIGMGHVFLTTEAVGGIPAGTQVRIGSAWFDGTAWWYGIYTDDGRSAEARVWQITYGPGPTPGPTPMMQFSGMLGMGYTMVTTEAVGSIPAGTRVRLSSARYDGSEWLYLIVAEDEQRSAEAHEGQLTYAPNVTPGPTPTAQFNSSIGMGGYNLVLKEAAGGIPAGARVRIGSARFDGTTWIYTVVAQDETRSADVRQSQLAIAPGVTPGPTPTIYFAPTPTARFGNEFMAGTPFITAETIGGIPEGTRVQITSTRYDGSAYWYGIVTSDGRSAEAREWQLEVARD